MLFYHLEEAQGKALRYASLLEHLGRIQKFRLRTRRNLQSLTLMQQQQFGAEQPFREQLLQALTNRQNTVMPRFMAQGMQYSNPYQRVNRTGVPGTSGVESYRPSNVNLGGPNIAAALTMAGEGRRGPSVQNPLKQQG